MTVPYVVGHRGAAGVRPENTLEGFRYAIDQGVDCVECDVHLTSDSQLVVMHDARVDRTTNGTGAIRDLSFDAIRRLDAGGGARVPTLDEVLNVVKGRTKLLCELKGEGVEEAAVDAVKARGLDGEVTFTCFDTERIARVKRRDDGLSIGAILPDPGEDDIQRAADIGAGAIGVRFKNVCYRVIEQVHQAGMQIRAWNPDTIEEQQAMVALGVDGVCTNRPDLLMASLRGRRSL